MVDHNEKTFIGRVKTALNVSEAPPRLYSEIFPGRPEETTQAILDRVQSRDTAQRLALLDRLKEIAETINLNVIALPDISAVTAAIAGLARDKQPEWGDHKQLAVWKHPLIDALGLPDALADQKIIVHDTALTDTETPADGRRRIREQIVAAYIGVTAADYCVADSATLVMKTRPGQARAASLVPVIHVAVIYLDQVLASLTELYVRLKADPDFEKTGITNCLTFISGPSKTADIEVVMVHGAHGPREVYLFVITGDRPAISQSSPTPAPLPESR